MRRFLVGGGVLAVFALGVGRLASQPPSFDRLSDADRAAFAKRFERELWPLLTRGGKDGCVGCHSAKGRPQPRFSGDAAKDFRMLVKEGFFLHQDPGNLVARVASKDKRTRMPPGNRPPWTAAETELLRQFTADLDARQGR
jgi:hypothetical protein